MIKKLLAFVTCLCFLASVDVKAQDTCRVALMVPLYLEQVNHEFWEEEPSNKTLLTKPFSFLHFYEGFMIAADSITSSRGMNLELKVYDVDNNIAKADSAIKDPWLNTANLIVGPFHLKAFNVLKKYASEHDIPIVNPITQHSDILEYRPNVIKVKPSMEAQLAPLDTLIREKYHANSVFIIRKEKYSDTLLVNKIAELARNSIDSCSYVSNEHIQKTIKRHHKRWKYLKMEFSNRMFYTDGDSLNMDSIRRSIDDSTAFINRVINVNYERDSLHPIRKYASPMRNNLIIVYGTDKVFANEIVNKVTKLVEYYPVTVIMLPEWSKFDGLFNDNLMKMHAIYFDDKYIDYQNIKVQSFICKFRNRYEDEPTDYAFQGFDIGWYFLNALRLYGNDMIEALADYDIPLLQTRFLFERKDEFTGYENTFWNIYQFKGYNKVVLPTGYAQ